MSQCFPASSGTSPFACSAKPMHGYNPSIDDNASVTLCNSLSVIMLLVHNVIKMML